MPARSTPKSHQTINTAKIARHSGNDPISSRRPTRSAKRRTDGSRRTTHENTNPQKKLSGSKNVNSKSYNSEEENVEEPDDIVKYLPEEKGLDTKHECDRLFVHHVDFFIALFVLSIFFALFMRGTWGLLDLTMLPRNNTISTEYYERRRVNKEYADVLSSAWICICFGSVIRVGTDFFQFHASIGHYMVSEYPTLRILYARCFLVLCCIGNVIYWRGVWYLCDYLFGTVLVSIILTLITMLIMLIGLRSLRTLIGTPLNTLMDSNRTIFKANPYLDTTFDEAHWTMYLADVCFSHFIMETALITCWWAHWRLEDHLFTPTEIGVNVFDENVVNWPALVAGACISTVCYSIQFCIEKMRSGKGCLQKSCFYIAYDVLVWFGFIGSLNVLRGLWSVFNHIPEMNMDPYLDSTISMLVGLLFMILLQSTSTLANRGLRFDFDEDEHIFVTHFVYYFKYKNGKYFLIHTNDIALKDPRARKSTKPMNPANKEPDTCEVVDETVEDDPVYGQNLSTRRRSKLPSKHTRGRTHQLRTPCENRIHDPNDPFVRRRAEHRRTLGTTGRKRTGIRDRSTATPEFQEGMFIPFPVEWAKRDVSLSLNSICSKTNSPKPTHSTRK